MRGMTAGLGLLTACLLAAAGCASDDHLVKPPPRPKELVRPPTDDPRFDSPPKYPQGTLNSDVLTNRIKEKADDPAKGPRFTGGMN
jgi:hypothetical protein